LKLGQDAEWLALEQKQWVPHLKDFIEIFVAKTQYYGTWKKAFDDAIRFPAMQDWLVREDDRKSDRAVWGEEKGSYSFRLEGVCSEEETELAERETASCASGSHAESRELSDRKSKKKNKKTRKDSSE
jgi:hypothetical protein